MELGERQEVGGAGLWRKEDVSEPRQERERERDRERETERGRQRERQTDRQRERERENKNLNVLKQWTFLPFTKLYVQKYRRKSTS